MELGGEIFETPDEPEDAVVPIDDLSKPPAAQDCEEAIDQSRVAAGQAFDRFVGAPCEVALEDFSDAIGSPGDARAMRRKGRTALTSSSLPLGMRFERICKEAEALFQDIEAAAKIRDGMAAAGLETEEGISPASPPPSLSASLRDEALALQARLLQMQTLAVGGLPPPQGSLAPQLQHQARWGTVGAAELAGAGDARSGQMEGASAKDGAANSVTGTKTSVAAVGTRPAQGEGQVDGDGSNAQAEAAAGKPAAGSGKVAGSEPAWPAAALASTWQLQAALGRQVARHVDSIWNVAGAAPGAASSTIRGDGADDTYGLSGDPTAPDQPTKNLPPAPPLLSYELYCLPPSRGDAADTLQGGAAGWPQAGMAQNPAAKVVELDQRLAVLERLVGVGAVPQQGAAAAPPGGRDLTRWVSDLARRVSLMDAADVELLERRLQLLTLRMKSLMEQKKAAGAAPSSTTIPASQEAKIKEMFSMMERWDPVARQLPSLIARLHALAGVHASSARFQDTLAALGEEQGVLAGVLLERQQLLDEVTKNVAVNVAAMAESMQVLEHRFSKISEKLQALE